MAAPCNPLWAWQGLNGSGVTTDTMSLVGEWVHEGRGGTVVKLTCCRVLQHYVHRISQCLGLEVLVCEPQLSQSRRGDNPGSSCATRAMAIVVK